MKNALRVYVAGVVGTGLTFLCHLFNHYPLPCWWTSNRLYRWADAITCPNEECGALQLPSTGEPLRCNRPRGHVGAHSYSVAGACIVWLS